jgi:hypothetical protein
MAYLCRIGLGEINFCWLALLVAVLFGVAVR